ncbi:hypothetical protein TELCIR_20761 [Teladorsagia circumcincta]|uniref:Uncharacterized protein n=1 Tax=Teladorsagia circumcincta TaxID=45464 RepID=A0A2G9TIL8_TELCI|nr:hypothetical protein TELCIR_20761 [Teladorsagia circumcincta]
MDDPKSPPDPGPASDGQCRYSLNLSHDAAETSVNFSNRDAADTSSNSLSRDGAAPKLNSTSPSDEGEAMDTSDGTVSGGTFTECATAAKPSSLAGLTTPSAVPQVSSSEEPFSGTFAEVAARSSTNSSASSSLAASQRKFHSERQLPKSDEGSMVSMASSMGHLSVAEAAPPQPPQWPAPVTPSTPPVKVMRSASPAQATGCHLHTGTGEGCFGCFSSTPILPGLYARPRSYFLEVGSINLVGFPAFFFRFLYQRDRFLQGIGHARRSRC